MRNALALASIGLLAIGPLGCTSPSRGEIVASGQTNPLTLAADGTSLFWITAATSQQLVRGAKDGSASSVIGAEIISDLPWPLAVGADMVYLNDRDSLGVYAKDGSGKLGPGASPGDPPEALLAAPDGLYYANHFAGGIVRLALTGASGIRLADDYAGALAIDDTFLYFTATQAGAIKRVPRQGGAVETLAAGQADCLFDLATDGVDVYFSEYHCAGGPGAIARMPIGGGTVEVIADDVGAATKLLLDGDDVIFLAAVSGDIIRMPKRGGSRTTIARASTETLGLVQDADFVYWTDRTTDTIRRAAK